MTIFLHEQSINCPIVSIIKVQSSTCFGQTDPLGLLLPGTGSLVTHDITFLRRLSLLGHDVQK